MLKGFKDFLMRGNVVDLAVAVVIGSAFGAVVTQLTTSFIEPLIKLIGGGGVSGGAVKVTGRDGAVFFDWAAFVNVVIYFVIVAAVVYFFVVLPMNKLLNLRKRHEEPEPESPSPDVALLTEIRDLLQAQAGGGPTVSTTKPSGPGGL
jgi:large conductance mechanosensitive channel